MLSVFASSLKDGYDVYSFFNSNGTPILTQYYNDCKNTIPQGIRQIYEKTHFHDYLLTQLNITNEELHLVLIQSQDEKTVTIGFEGISSLRLDNAFTSEPFSTPIDKRKIPHLSQVLDVWFAKDSDIHMLIVLSDGLISIACKKITLLDLS